MKKRFLAMLLVLAMLFGMLPTSVIASETEAPVMEDTTASVYFSVSHDADYLAGEQTGEVLAMKKIEVPYFDLANYDLTDFYFMSESYGDGDGDGAPGGNEFETTEPYEGKVTMLHLLIYATEVFNYGVTPEEAGQGYLKNEGILGTEVLSVGGSAGSMVINYFWGFDMNLNYYVNYEYPLASEGWGATLDQILLKDGDLVSIGHFTGWSFYSDPISIFNYLKVGEDIGTTTVNQGDQVTFSAYHAGSDFSGSGATAHTAITYQPDVYCTSVENMTSGEVTTWEYLATVTENGEFTIDTTDMEPGEYLISMAGQYGEMYSDEICAAPGGIRLVVEGKQPVEELPYADVAETDWFYDAAYFNYSKDFMMGKDEVTFAPYESLSRAELAIILYRMDGAPEVAYEGTFEDVEDGVWYTDAVAWAVANNVMTGYADGTFGPQDMANREQMAVILYRYAALKGYDTTATADLSAFEDGASVSVYAEEAMKWAVGSGIILGKGNGTELAPQSEILRCECAVMIHRFEDSNI